MNEEVLKVFSLENRFFFFFTRIFPCYCWFRDVVSWTNIQREPKKIEKVPIQ